MGQGSKRLTPLTLDLRVHSSSLFGWIRISVDNCLVFPGSAAQLLAVTMKSHCYQADHDLKVPISLVQRKPLP